MTLQVANTILAQLGGNRFVAMTGATNLLGGNNTLSMKIGRNEKKVTHVRIALTPADEYHVEFLNIRGMKITRTALREHVQVEDLRRVFTTETGLVTSL